MRNDFQWRDAYASYINLAQRTDRLTHMRNELMRVGLIAHRTPGMLPQEYVGDFMKIQTMYHRTKGAIGCHFSQVKIMGEALAANRDAFVMEDDLVFCSDIQKRLDHIQNFLNSHEWDVFFLGGTVHVNPPWWHKPGHSPDLQMCDCTLGRDAEQTDDKHILRTYGAFSTHAYIVNKNSIEKILKYFDDNIYLSMGIDWLFIKMQPQLNAFCFVPGCVKQMDNQSNIGAGMTIFSGFASLGAHWWQDDMDNFNPEQYNWAEATKR